MQLRKFQTGDAPSVAAMVATTLRTTNAKDYPADYLARLIATLTPTFFIEKARATHFYVGVAGAQIVCCGAVGSYWGRAQEASLFDVFVAPAFQGRGLGRALMATLLADPLATLAKRIEIPASLTAVGFYQHFGFTFKHTAAPDDEGLVRMEKWCPFCTLPVARIVDENDLALAFFDRTPASPGHLLVIPKRHCHDFFDLTAPELTAMQSLLNRGKKRLDETLHPDGYNVGFNVNQAGGQSVWHTHCHLIPRYQGDIAEPLGGIRQVLDRRN